MTKSTNTVSDESTTKWNKNMQKKVSIADVTIDCMTQSYGMFSIKKVEKNGGKYMVKVSKLPYDLPKTYSLEQEENILLSIAERTINLRKRFSRSDMDAISQDWMKIGEDLNGAIRKATN